MADEDAESETHNLTPRTHEIMKHNRSPSTSSSRTSSGWIEPDRPTGPWQNATVHVEVDEAPDYMIADLNLEFMHLETSMRFACAAFLHTFPVKTTTCSGGRPLVFLAFLLPPLQMCHSFAMGRGSAVPKHPPSVQVKLVSSPTTWFVQWSFYFNLLFCLRPREKVGYNSLTG